MQFEYINPFADSASRTLSKLVQAPVRKGDLSLRNSPVPNQGVATMIEITGRVQGRVIFDMNAETARRMAGALNGKKFETLTPLALDTIAELANMMIGDAVTVLNNQGFEFSMAPPTIVTGQESSGSNVNLEALVIPLHTPYGDVIVNVALRFEEEEMKSR